MLKKYILKNSHRYASKWLVLAIDTLVIAFSFVLSYIIRFNLSFDFDVSKLLVQLPVVMVMAAAAFVVTGSHKGFVRHTGISLTIRPPIPKWLGLLMMTRKKQGNASMAFLCILDRI